MRSTTRLASVAPAAAAPDRAAQRPFRASPPTAGRRATSSPGPTAGQARLTHSFSKLPVRLPDRRLPRPESHAARQPALKLVPEPPIQRSLEPGGYAEAKSGKYVEIVDKLPAADHLEVVDLATGRSQIIRVGGTEHEHLRRAPTYGLSIATPREPVYLVQPLEGSGGAVLISEADLREASGAEVESILWAAGEARKEAALKEKAAKTKAREEKEGVLKEALGRKPISALRKGRRKPNPAGWIKKYLEKEKAALATEKEAKQQASSMVPEWEREARTGNLGFVRELAAGGIGPERASWLLQTSKAHRQTAFALRDLLLAQPDTDDTALAAKVLSSELPAIELALTCADLLSGGANAENSWLAGCYMVEAGKPGAAFIKSRAVANCATLDDEIYFLKGQAQCEDRAVLALQTLGITSSLLGDLKPLLKQRKKWVVWLLGLRAETHYDRFLQFVAGKKLQDVKGLLDFNTANQGYAFQDVLRWMQSAGVTRVHQVLSWTTYEVRPTFVTLFLAYKAKGAERTQFVNLIRLDAILNDAPNTLFAVYRNDRRYASSQDPPSRTGFMRYTFTNGDVAEIHTHWNVNKKKVVSMHIQAAGKNGVEINTWKFFAKVANAIVASHNAATGGRIPTTVPTGKPLTL